MSSDPRFASLSKNARFLQAKKKDNKVAIDDRFASIFDKNKGDSTGVKEAKTDKYGRRKKNSRADDLKRFYKLKEEEVTKSEEEGDEEVAAKEVEKVEKVEEDSEDDEVEQVNHKEQARRMIRGEGLVESSDEEQDEEEPDSDVEIEMQAEEDEKDQEEEILGPISKRFAAVNMDWDNIKARDLYKVFDAFRPKSGILHSIKIYKSEFGKTRLAQESREGPPRAIFKTSGSSKQEEQSLFTEEEGKDFDDDQLRQYQLDRLKYYYAVAECDSAATANAIFTAVDGTEFEKSANVFNLQFIPDTMSFADDTPEEVATSVPDATYTPGNFSTAALQHSKAQLTWDLDDPDRVRVTRKKFSKEELKEMDFKAYLASESEESSGDEEEMRERMKKYKSLVEPEKEEGEGSEDDGEAMGNMEITFTPGLSEAAAGKMKKLVKEKEEAENDNVFLQERRKRKEKAKLKKSLKDDAFFNDNGSDPASSDAEPTPRAPVTKKSAALASEKQLAELSLMMFDETNATAS
ncbi:pre-rRNA-processing protein esf1, partial [Podochytrium sp. JEL0797]